MTRATIGRPTEILLVEDNLDDAGVTINALKQGDIRCRVSLVRDGEEAMSFLRHEGVFAQTPQPDVILLDMELPKKDGQCVLFEIRNDQRFAAIPVLVLTASAVHRAVLQAQKLHIDGFMTKPVSLEQFICAVKSVQRSRLIELVVPAESLRAQATATGV